MNRYSFFILCVLLGLLPVSATDPVELHGTVVDADTDEPVVGCIVKSKGAFSSTDKDGRFVITLKAGADSVSFRFMGYESRSLPVAADFTCVRLKPKATQLNDVIIEAPDIYAKGDTLVFNVARYATAKDNAIIDVIKRLPGIKVEDDGTIKYQGKPINKFYLDGNDFLGGQYGLATNNISHTDVKSVEVMENHQPVKALEGIEFPEEAGINLKLKEDARNRWVGVLKAACGEQPLLYDGSIFAMRMASKMQNLFTLKGDNTGWNPANEIKEHDFNDMFSVDYDETPWPKYISADIVAAPLSDKRTRDNLSWLANSISSWKSGDTSMRMKINYMADHLDYYSGVETDYLTSQIPDFRQNNALHTNSHDLSLQLNSEINKRRYFLKDKFTVNSMWNNSGSSITGSFDLSQRISRRTFSASNDLKLVRRTDMRLFSLTSRNSFSRRPDALSIDGTMDADQILGTSDFRSSTETQFGKLLRFWKYYLTAGVDLNYNRLRTSLSGMGAFDNAELYNSFISNVYATPQVDYERNRWRISLKAPLKWMHYSVRCRYDYLVAAPRLSARRQITAKSELSASLTYRMGAPQPFLNIEAPILSDYRNLFIASNPHHKSHDITASASYRYRNPLRSLFFNVSAAYTHRWSSSMSNQLFIGDFIVTTYAHRLFSDNSCYFNAGISKGLGHSKMVIGCDINQSISSTSSMRNDEVIPYRQFTLSAKPYFKGSLVSWLSAIYEANYTFSKLIVHEMPNDYHTFNQNLSLTIAPADIVQFTLGADNYLTRLSDGKSAAITLLDISAVYRINNRIRLSLTGDNLLDKRNYQYVSYATLSRSNHWFRIRPRTVLASVQYRF